MLNRKCEFGGTSLTTPVTLKSVSLLNRSIFPRGSSSPKYFFTMLSVIIEKGLLKSNRKMKLTVTLVDKPGSLMKLTELLKTLYANIVHIAYDRTSTTLDYGDANVTIHLETKGKEHQDEIRSVLLKHGYLSSEMK